MPNWKNVPGTTVAWSLELIESIPGSLNSPVYVLIKKNGEEKQIFLDSLVHLVELLVREFDDGRNFIGVPPMAVNRAARAIADYFSLGDLMSDLEYEYYKFIQESGIKSPCAVITPSEIKELYERSATLKRKLQGSNADVDPQEAIDLLDKHLKSDDEKTQEY